MSLKRRNRKLLRESSSRWTAVLGCALGVILCLGIFVRFYAIEQVRIVESSMEPDVSSGDLVWICKLPFCTQKLNRGDLVLFQIPRGGFEIRSIFGLPGDSVEVFPEGKIRTGEKEFTWNDESEIIAHRKFYVPKKGDSIRFENLNDISFDYASDFLQQAFGIRKYFARAELFRGEDSLPLSRIGSAHLFGRPVSLSEIHGLRWQEYVMIALQVGREEPGARSVHFERKLFRAEDSTEVKAFSPNEDAYYLICFKGNRCEDSRYFGYVPKSAIAGKVIRPQKLFGR